MIAGTGWVLRPPQGLHMSVASFLEDSGLSAAHIASAIFILVPLPQSCIHLMPRAPPSRRRVHRQIVALGAIRQYTERQEYDRIIGAYTIA